MNNIYITHKFTPKHAMFGYSAAACLSVIYALLSGLISFESLWHAGRILDKNVNMNYSYPTTMYEMYVFLIEIFYLQDLLVFHGR